MKKLLKLLGLFILTVLVVAPFVMRPDQLPKNWLGEIALVLINGTKDYLLNTLIILGMIYFPLRVITMALAPGDTLFSSPKLGRIKAVKKNGKFVRFLPHLKGLTGELAGENDGDPPYVGPVHMDEETGQVLPGEERIWSLWWIVFGVRWIGLNDIHVFQMPKKVVGANGVVTTEMVTARSLHFTNVFLLSVLDKETATGVRGDLHYSLTTQTTNARETLKYADWYDKIQPPSVAVAKVYVSHRNVQQMIQDQSELSDDSNGFVGTQRVLNDERVGNISLHRQVGQRVVAASLTEVAFEDEVANSLEALEIARNTGTAAVETARLAADAAEQAARGDRATRQVEVDMLTGIANALKGEGGENTARVEVARHLKEAVKGFQGKSLGIGGNMVSNLPLNGEE